MAVKITGKPTGKPSLKAPTRNDNKVTASWTIDSAYTSGSKHRRIQQVNVEWNFFYEGSDKPITVTHKSLDKSKKTDSIDINYDTRQWYPKTDKKLQRITVRVQGHNSKGNGPWTEPQFFDFAPPDAPLYEDTKLDLDTGIISTTISKQEEESSSNKECLNISWTEWRTDSSNPDRVMLGEGLLEGKSELLSVDVPDSKDLTQDQWIKITFEGFSRGLAGDGVLGIEEHVVAWPAVPEITSHSAQGIDTPSQGMVLIGVRTNHDPDRHPVTEVQLQRVKNMEPNVNSTTVLAFDWEDVQDATDNELCTGFSDELANAVSLGGKYTWYRVKASHDGYNVFSDPIRMDEIRSAFPTAEDDSIEILSTSRSGDNGTSAVIEVGWDDDDSTGNELSWSDDENAWRSTDSPDSFLFSWEDDDVDTEHPHAARIHVAGLTQGKPYFFKARRVMETDSGTTYGMYSNTVTIVPVSKPSNVHLKAPVSVERGKDIVLSWTFTSDAEQTGWMVLDEDGKVWGSGQDSSGTCVIKAEAIPDEATSMAFMVKVTTGGDWADSLVTDEAGAEPGFRTVLISDRPECSVEFIPATGVTYDDKAAYDALAAEAGFGPNILAAQPLRFRVTSSEQKPTVIATLVSRGAAMQLPDGEYIQSKGDVVWSDVITDGWDESGLVAEITCPDGLELFDMTGYELKITVQSQSTGLISYEEKVRFTAMWAHSAYPSSPVVVIVDGEAEVYFAKPSGARDTDVADVYRVTPDGAYLIAEDVQFGVGVTDPLAPFSNSWGGELYYRVATKTVDGDVDWSDDGAFENHGYSLVFDWGGGDGELGGHLELPYNITMADTIEKSFEARGHLDGKVNGYWGESTMRSSSLTTDLISFRSAEEKAALRSLARHNGPVFVRTPDGCAFPANVSLGSIQHDYSTLAVAVSLDCTEVEMTEEFMGIVGIEHGYEEEGD